MISPQGTARIEELLQEDKNVKHRRERYQKQSSLLSKLTHQLSIHDNRAAATASSWRNGDGADAAANGSLSRSASNGHSQHYGGATQNGDVSSRSNSSSRRTPNRLPPTPPRSGSSGYRN
ncbi:hypothetical protein OIU85_003998 [Salix viminalis]|uniref:GED domain-containing protein n=1 Tax=Salix viminalis TaxID=40686 RepID=A0A9Q0PRN3_SALVM|nr:hypothetical protein OIU85_003998 [Salix viminalis]